MNQLPPGGGKTEGPAGRVTIRGETDRFPVETLTSRDSDKANRKIQPITDEVLRSQSEQMVVYYEKGRRSLARNIHSARIQGFFVFNGRVAFPIDWMPLVYAPIGIHGMSITDTANKMEGITIDIEGRVSVLASASHIIYPGDPIVPDYTKQSFKYDRKGKIELNPIDKSRPKTSFNHAREVYSKSVPDFKPLTYRDTKPSLVTLAYAMFNKEPVGGDQNTKKSMLDIPPSLFSHYFKEQQMMDLKKDLPRMLFDHILKTKVGGQEIKEQTWMLKFVSPNHNLVAFGRLFTEAVMYAFHDAAIIEGGIFNTTQFTENCQKLGLITDADNNHGNQIDQTYVDKFREYLFMLLNAQLFGTDFYNGKGQQTKKAFEALKYAVFGQEMAANYMRILYQRQILGTAIKVQHPHDTRTRIGVFLNIGRVYV